MSTKASIAFSWIPFPSLHQLASQLENGMRYTTGSTTSTIIANPKDPSQPTTNSGGSLRSLRNFSSTTIWKDDMICERITQALPIITREVELPLELDEPVM